MKGEKKRRGRGKRRIEEEKEGDQAKVWKLTLSMDFYDFWYGTLWNSKVCMKFHAIVW